MFQDSLVQRDTILLVDFPSELLTAICLCVGCPAVVWCRSICRRLCDVIDASLEIQYRIELARDGMIDQSPRVASSSHTRRPLLTTNERLARLRQLRAAWTSLSWTRIVTVPMPGPCCAYELVGGAFCKTQPRQGQSAHGLGAAGWHDVAVAQYAPWDGAGVGGDGDTDAGSRTMSMTWLPGRLGLDAHAAHRGRTVVRDDLGVPTRDFAMDPSQDLMVLFKGGMEDAGMQIVNVYPGVIELYVRTISSNRTHPEARVPVLRSPVLYPITNVFVQIAIDVVGIMYCIDSAQPRITIWHWKTGNMVVNHGSDLMPGTYDFAFINHRALFLTTTNGGGTLELYSFTCDPVAADASGLTHVATLYMPSIQTFTHVLDVSTHAGPFLAGCPPDKPFTASNEERIHVLTIQYVHLHTMAGPRTRLRTCVFVHNRVLAAYLARAHDVRTGSVGALEVSWSDWGQTHARMMTCPGIFQWLRYVHGQRVVLLHPSSDMHTNTLQVLDFNVRHAWREDVVDGHADDRADRVEDRDATKDEVRCNVVPEVVDYPTRIVMPNIFAGVVESGLPYRDVRRDVCGEYSGVMIDDERLVGLKVRTFLTKWARLTDAMKQYPVFMMGDLKEIDVFTM